MFRSHYGEVSGAAAPNSNLAVACPVAEEEANISDNPLPVARVERQALLGDSGAVDVSSESEAGHPLDDLSEA